MRDLNNVDTMAHRVCRHTCSYVPKYEIVYSKGRKDEVYNNGEQRCIENCNLGKNNQETTIT